MGRPVSKESKRLRPLPGGLMDYMLTGELPGRVSGWVETLQLAHHARRDELRVIWEQRRDEILADYIRRYPGQRPHAWWELDAPRWLDAELPAWRETLAEPRRRLGGSGTPRHELEDCYPQFVDGMPVDLVGVDPADPPAFESVAAYLDRHALLSVDERQRLTEADFRAEILYADGSP
jgi:hypothetical protein